MPPGAHPRPARRRGCSQVSCWRSGRSRYWRAQRRTWSRARCPPRAKCGWISSRLRSQHVSESAPRVNQARTPAALELLANVSHVHVDDVAVAVGTEVVDAARDLFAAHDFALAGREKFEDSVFARGELDDFAAASHFVQGGVDFEIGDTHHRRALAVSTSLQRSHTRHQLIECEGFNEIVVRSEI